MFLVDWFWSGVLATAGGRRGWCPRVRAAAAWTRACGSSAPGTSRSAARLRRPSPGSSRPT